MQSLRCSITRKQYLADQWIYPLELVIHTPKTPERCHVLK